MLRALVFATTLTAALPAIAADAPTSGIEIGARVGYAFAAGSTGMPPNDVDRNVGDFVPGQLPVWLDAGYRFNREAYLGAYFQYGFGVVNDDRQDLCRVDNVDCSASDVRLGLMGRYHLPIVAPLSPWLGLGIGYEWASFSIHQSAIGSSDMDFNWSGFEFVNLQAGADYHVARQVVIAPFVSVSIGQFQGLSTTLATNNSSDTTDRDIADKSVHEWILIGARAAFAP